MARTKASLARFQAFDDVYVVLEEICWKIVISVEETDKVPAHDKVEGYFQHPKGMLDCLRRMWICRGKSGDFENKIDSLEQIYKSSDEFLVMLCGMISQELTSLRAELKCQQTTTV